MYKYRNLPKNKHRHVFLNEIYRKTNIDMYLYRNPPKNKHRYVFLYKSTEKQT